MGAGIQITPVVAMPTGPRRRWHAALPLLAALGLGACGLQPRAPTVAPDAVPVVDLRSPRTPPPPPEATVAAAVPAKPTRVAPPRKPQTVARSTLRSAPPTRSTAPATAAAPAAAGPHADFGRVQPSPAVREVADWVVASSDNQNLPFAIVDKTRARVYVFGTDGRIRGSAPVLLGAARGDHTVPGIGDRPLNQVLPHEKTTPAGRFVAERGRNTNGEDIVWVDYDAAVSMHRVRANVAAERRLQRLASPTAADNRISFGCINLPVGFYEQVLQAALARGKAIVYVLPETRPLHEVFAMAPPARSRQLARAGAVATDPLLPPRAMSNATH